MANLLKFSIYYNILLNEILYIIYGNNKLFFIINYYKNLKFLLLYYYKY